VTFAARALPRTLGAVALCAAVVSSATTSARGSTVSPAVSVKRPPPDFTFDVGAGPQRLRDLVGHPVVLSFWATWCRPCLDELPTLVRLEQTYGDKIALITISSEGKDVARSYLISQNIALPLVEDPSKRIFGAYAVDDIPVTIVLDGSGRTRYVSVGETSWDELSAAVDGALKIGAPA
jgi:thiol-disulfide isomerase/thioredoxin